jgi:hypothetical protein
MGTVSSVHSCTAQCCPTACRPACPGLAHVGLKRWEVLTSCWGQPSVPASSTHRPRGVGTTGTGRTALHHHSEFFSVGTRRRHYLSKCGASPPCERASLPRRPRSRATAGLQRTGRYGTWRLTCKLRWYQMKESETHCSRWPHICRHED